MRLPNGYGTVRKLSGNRRKPYAALVTVGWKFDKVKEKSIQVQKYLGYYASKKEAMQALTEYNADPYDLESRQYTFAEVWEQVKEKELSKKSASVLKSYTTPYNKCQELYNMRFADIKASHLEAQINTQSGTSASTQQNMLKLFRLMYSYAVKYEIAKKDHAEYLTIGQVADSEKKTILKPKHVRLVEKNLDWCFDENGNTIEQSHLVDSVLFLLYTGVRLGELLNIKCEDVHDGYIEIHGTKTDASDRLLPIHSKVAVIVAERLSRGNEYLFTYDNGEKLTMTQYRSRFFKLFCHNILKEDFNPHECRHTFISYCLNCGVNEYALKKIVGHKFGDVTNDTYNHITPETISLLSNELEKLEY